MTKIFILLFLLSFCTKQLQSTNPENQTEEIAVCYNISFFKKKCFLFLKNNDNSIVDIMFYVNNFKPKRNKDAFYKFDFFKKINYLEAKEYSIKTCKELKGDVEYFELSYDKHFNIAISGLLNIWCKSSSEEIPLEVKTTDNNTNISKTTTYE